MEEENGSRYPGFCPSRLVKLGGNHYSKRPTWSRRRAPVDRLGLAPCGVCPAALVTLRAVRSYRTFSPLPLRAVYFLWHFPWKFPPPFRAAHCPVESGSSSPCAGIGRERLPGCHLHYTKTPRLLEHGGRKETKKRNIAVWLIVQPRGYGARQDAQSSAAGTGCAPSHRGVVNLGCAG